jgi:CBS-domain-containing membrane protein
MGIGFLAMITGAFISGIWILLIGWFLNSGAQAYLAQHELTTILAGVRLRDIMNTRIIAVPRDTTVDELLKNYFSAYMKSSFPVVNCDDGRRRLAGMVTLKMALDIPDNRRQRTRTEEVMIPAGDLVVMQPDRKADEALTEMTRTDTNKVFVFNVEGTLLGLVSKTDIMNVASERQDYQKEIQGRGDAATAEEEESRRRKPAAATDSTTEAA